MALVVASTSTASANNSGSVVVTKPTGVASGDLLIILGAGEHDGNNGLGNSVINCTGFTESVQVAREGNNVNTDLNVEASLLYRIADSSDVSASNYTVNFDSSEAGGIVAMLRITGWTTGNPVLYKHESNVDFDATSGISVLRPSPQLLIMANVIKRDNVTFSFASPSITSSHSNPTWTEVFDTSIEVNNSTDSRSISAAFYYANSSDTSTITGYDITETQTGGTGGTSSGVSFLAVIVEPTNVTVDVSPLAVTPTLFAPTVTQVNTAPSVGHLDGSPTLFSPTAQATQPSVWTNVPKS